MRVEIVRFSATYLMVALVGCLRSFVEGFRTVLFSVDCVIIRELVKCTLSVYIITIRRYANYILLFSSVKP